MTLTQTLYERAISHYRQFERELWMVKPSIPILYFGDLQAYLASTHKIVTVGLNPSNVEFVGARFGAQVIEALEPSSLEGALCGYFHTNPYSAWFDRAYESLLQPLGASFYSKHHPGRAPHWWKPQPSTALHTDIGTPLATNPTWSRLPNDAKVRMQATGLPLWLDLMEELQPDLILMSVAAPHLGLLGDVTWRLFEPFTSAKPAHQMRIGKLGKSTVVWGKAQVTPFFHLTNAQRSLAAETILREARL